MIEMKRAKEGVKIEELIEEKISGDITDLRDMMYTCGMQYADDIKNIYVAEIEEKRKILDDNKITFRAKELWTPYLCVAMFIDKHDKKANVFNDLITKAKQGIETAEAFDGDSKSLEIIELLYKWTKSVQNGLQEDMRLQYDGDIYMRSGITDSFIKVVLKQKDFDDDYDYVTYQVLKKVLRKFHVIDKDCEHKSFSTRGKKGVALELKPSRILESLITYKKDFDDEVMEDVFMYKTNKGLPVEEQIFNMEDFD
tara:strand:- start:1940 stop:2701 length:762 start_codon:yes stop_codon:yes gene_type:complete